MIAGNKPSIAIREAAAAHANVTLVDSPDKEQMEHLINGAHVHLLITFQPTGIKLKLLNVLYAGGHVVVNPPMVTGTDIAELCAVGRDDRELIHLCQHYIDQPVSAEEPVRMVLPVPEFPVIPIIIFYPFFILILMSIKA